jgi:hypothetical protein
MRHARLAFTAVIAIAIAAPAAAQNLWRRQRQRHHHGHRRRPGAAGRRGLSNTCEDGCDVDGSGVITVSDGVNILRKAAGLASTRRATSRSRRRTASVGPSLSIFDALTKVPGVGSASALIAGGDCDNDGTVERVQAGASSAASFTNCQIGGAILDGTISRAVLGQGVVVGFDGSRSPG